MVPNDGYLGYMEGRWRVLVLRMMKGMVNKLEGHDQDIECKDLQQRWSGTSERLWERDHGAEGGCVIASAPLEPW